MGSVSSTMPNLFEETHSFYYGSNQLQCPSPCAVLVWVYVLQIFQYCYDEWFHGKMRSFTVISQASHRSINVTVLTGSGWDSDCRFFIEMLSNLIPFATYFWWHLPPNYGCNSMRKRCFMNIYTQTCLGFQYECITPNSFRDTAIWKSGLPHLQNWRILEKTLDIGTEPQIRTQMEL